MTRLKHRVLDEGGLKVHSQYQMMFLMPRNIMRHLFSLLKPRESESILRQNENALLPPSSGDLEDGNLIGGPSATPESRYLQKMRQFMTESKNLYAPQTDFVPLDRSPDDEPVNPDFLQSPNEPVEAESTSAENIALPDDSDDLEADSSNQLISSHNGKSSQIHQNLAEPVLDTQNDVKNNEHEQQHSFPSLSGKRKNSPTDEVSEPKRFRLSKEDVMNRDE